MFSLVLLLGIVAADPANNAATESSHRPQSLQIWEGYFNAKSNLRYHLAESARCGWWDRALRGATLFLSVLALTGPLLYSKAWLKWLWVGIGIVAFIAASALFVWPFGQWAANDTIAASRWNKAANDWYALYEEQGQLTPDETREKLVALRKEVVQIEDAEDASRFDPLRMLAAEKAEMEYQGIKNKPKPEPTKQANR